MAIQFRQDWINDVNMMQQEISRLLDYFTGVKPPMVRFLPTVWEPAIDLYETNDEVIVMVELAGVKEADFQIVVDRNSFTIRGERQEILPAGMTATYHQMEIVRGHFERSIALLVAVDANHARASYEDGIVEVTLPKAEEKRTVRVEVKVTENKEREGGQENES